jgi:hypothetical protein
MRELPVCPHISRVSRKLWHEIQKVVDTTEVLLYQRKNDACLNLFGGQTGRSSLHANGHTCHGEWSARAISNHRDRLYPRRRARGHERARYRCIGRVARTLSYAEGAPSSGFEGGSCVWVLSSRSPNPSEAIVSARTFWISLVLKVETPTAPWPILRVLHRAANDRIGVHVAHLRLPLRELGDRRNVSCNF